MYKIIFVVFIVVGVKAQHYGGHQEVDYYAEPHYYFEYDVKDDHTGDFKSHKEERKGDHTHGVYSLAQPDGSKRVVEYSVEGKHGGFVPKAHRDPVKHIDNKGHGHGISVANQNFHQGGVHEVHHSGGYSGGSSGGLFGNYHSHGLSGGFGDNGGSFGGNSGQLSVGSFGGFSNGGYDNGGHSNGEYSNRGYSNGGYDNGGYSNGGASSSVTLSTNGAKIYTSTKHLAPHGHGY